MENDKDKKLYDLLSAYQAPLPRADYKQAFWVGLVGRKQPSFNPMVVFKWGMVSSLLGMLLFGVVIFNQIRLEGQMAQLNDDFIQMIAHADIVENLDILQDFTAIANLDELDALDIEGTV